MKAIAGLRQQGGDEEKHYSLVLPVLFYEYLALSLARSLIPSMMVDNFGLYSYAVVGAMEAVRGSLAFVACPLFGKLSDRVGRKFCLMASVAGTTLPTCMLFVTQNMYVFVALSCISGLFSATFPLTFAYISDTVDLNHRAEAYGLALATFGLSFSIGPIIGAYVSEAHGKSLVFATSTCLVLIDFVYIIFFLPETVRVDGVREPAMKKVRTLVESIPNTWNIGETFQIFSSDRFMKNIALTVFLYYTSLWAVVSTLMVYVIRKLNFTPMEVGLFLSSYGVCTMVSEGILVRVIVPRIGELNAIRLGLFAFACQTVMLALSTSQRMIFMSISLSLLSNLVYPSVSSLVSKNVPASTQGEAQGALNGIKALTEGIGPLAFGGLMGLYEDSEISGAPYLLATVLVLWALLHTYDLPKDPGFVYEKDTSEMNEGEDTIHLLAPETLMPEYSL
jgi:DHA1 family tetracycline resistance protein-like MFS transporter